MLQHSPGKKFTSMISKVHLSSVSMHLGKPTSLRCFLSVAWLWKSSVLGWLIMTLSCHWRKITKHFLFLNLYPPCNHWRDVFGTALVYRLNLSAKGSTTQFGTMTDRYGYTLMCVFVCVHVHVCVCECVRMCVCVRAHWCVNVHVSVHLESLLSKFICM